jgi:hypothetical protein
MTKKKTSTVNQAAVNGKRARVVSGGKCASAKSVSSHVVVRAKSVNDETLQENSTACEAESSKKSCRCTGAAPAQVGGTTNNENHVDEESRPTTTSLEVSVTARKKRQSNNLAIALGRMTHVKSKTLACMKAFEKKTRNVPISVSMHKMPSFLQLRPLIFENRLEYLDCSIGVPVESVALISPLEVWTPSHLLRDFSVAFASESRLEGLRENLPKTSNLTFDISHVCSFCGEKMTGNINVEFNAMLSSPYVLACTSCLV